MTHLTAKELQALLERIATTTPDALDCGGCFQHFGAYAELQLGPQPIAEWVTSVEMHLSNCPCCREELATLMEALHS